MKTKVAIVGTGLSGLRAAQLLQRAGVDYVLIEACDRLGGRILTVDATGTPGEGFDQGPSWYWPHMQPPIGKLVEELGLPGFAQNGEGDVVFERMSREPARRYTGHPQEPQSMRFAGGTGALVRALAGAIPPERILLSTKVTAMTLRNDSVEIAVATGGSAPTLVAAHVITAIPPRLLDAGILFQPDPEAAIRRRWRDTATWMAPHAKFVAVYARPFWRAAGLSGTAQSMVGPMMAMHDATTASGEAALFGFLGVPADQRASAGEEALTAFCLDQFVRVFGEQARHPTATFLKDWTADPLTATSADRVAGGHAMAGRATWEPAAWMQRLAVAGSEVSPFESGYLAGAVVAAELAVERTLAALPASITHD